MSKKLEEIESIGPVFAGKLRDAGVTTQEKLLELCGRPEGRKEIGDKTGFETRKILGWVNRADLARVKGVGEEYADLLEHSGVDTVVELGTRNAENLYAKMQEVNGEKNLCRALPSQSQVEGWVAEAKGLDRKVHY